MMRKSCAAALAAAVFLAGCSTGTTPVTSTPTAISTAPPPVTTTTPQAAIQHVVVIFGENISFDHYFGTYPKVNPTSGEGASPFTASTSTPTNIENYTYSPNAAKLVGAANPNATNTANGAGASGPFRLPRTQAYTGDQNHSYTPEETAFDNGKMDQFPLGVGVADSPAVYTGTNSTLPITATSGLTMGYYDGSTTTALWNYAQRYALNDHSFGTNFGPSTDGALNLISGQLNGVVNDLGASGSVVGDGSTTGGLTLTSDVDPANDICSSTTSYAHMTGQNVGDLLNQKSVTWGFFEGGFDLTRTNPNGTTGCARSTVSPILTNPQITESDYIPHHEPFQYYATTANPKHTRPNTLTTIGGSTDGANHQYDIHDFTDALTLGYMPQVSYLKAPGYEDAHAGYSDPLDEQRFVVDIINQIQQSKFWPNTAIIIAYDDSDGWYDHVVNIVNGSATSRDTFNGANSNLCTTATAASTAALPGVDPVSTPHAQGRCGYGPRLPLLVISPWARANFVDNTVTDQTSILKFIEDIFLGSTRIGQGGQGSFDSIAGSLNNMFDFAHTSPPNPNVVIMDDTTGVVKSGN